ncbi:MAG: 3-phosphoglycerate dehydrogenase family protein [Fusobacteria bacterium]|nr:3-phosphoglycerate dehydrogenase family protein [Fusobacteriota bacterium]
MFKIKLLDKFNYDKTISISKEFEFVDDIFNANAVIVRSSKINLSEIPENIKIIVRAGIGVNNIPLDACAERGIIACNTPGANANAVKELVLLGLLASVRKIDKALKWLDVESCNPDIENLVEKSKAQFVGCELTGKTLGIIGLGKIGAQVANMGIQLGMRVIGYDPHLTIEAAWHMDKLVERTNSVKEILVNCDFISIHIPLLPSTKGYINSDSFAQMKKGATLLNFSRGEIIDSNALRTTLETDHLNHYICDFPTAETMNLPNTLFLPHLGASTLEAERNCGTMALHILFHFLKYGNIQHGVNYPTIIAGGFTSKMRLVILHKNVPNMVGQITSLLAKESVNIADMTNKSLGEYAISLLDLDSHLSASNIEKISSIENILKLYTYPSLEV